MKPSVAHFVILIYSVSNGLVQALTPSDLWCTQSALHAIRIQGCNEQPCTIRKGQQLPFEIDLSYSGSNGPTSEVSFSAWIPYYAVPPAAYGSELSRASCKNGRLGFPCPMNGNVMYTLRSNLFLDSRAQCTAGCNGLGPGGTGLRTTQWSWNIYKPGSSAVSSCSFEITFNIVL